MNAYIYVDSGASKCHSNYAGMCFKKLGYEVKEIMAENIIDGDLEPPALLVMPGGYDLGYVEKLDGHGIMGIREFVENGGTYVGFCAGAYFASAWCQFKLGTSIEVNERRALSLHKGRALGVSPGSGYSFDCPGIVTVRPKDSSMPPFRSYLNGGCCFPEALPYEVFAYY